MLLLLDSLCLSFLPQINKHVWLAEILSCCGPRGEMDATLCKRKNETKKNILYFNIEVQNVAKATEQVVLFFTLVPFSFLPASLYLTIFKEMHLFVCLQTELTKQIHLTQGMTPSFRHQVLYHQLVAEP